jgi:hypothetical protein
MPRSLTRGTGDISPAERGGSGRRGLEPKPTASSRPGAPRSPLQSEADPSRETHQTNQVGLILPCNGERDPDPSCSEAPAFAPCSQELVDPLQPIPVCKLDQRLDPGPSALARQSGKGCKSQLSVGERQPSLDGEPACPLRCGSEIGLRLSLQERQADSERVLEPRWPRELGDDRADLIRRTPLDRMAQAGDRMPLGCQDAWDSIVEHMFASRLLAGSTASGAFLPAASASV